MPGVCTGDKDTVVACHSNELTRGKHTGGKAHDCYIAFGCAACHFALDQGMYPRVDKDEWFQRGMDRTWLYLWEQGKIQVCAEPLK